MTGRHFIRTQFGQVVPLEANRAQVALAGMIQRHRAAGARIILIASSRTLGVTTFAQALLADERRADRETLTVAGVTAGRRTIRSVIDHLDDGGRAGDITVDLCEAVHEATGEWSAIHIAHPQPSLPLNLDAALTRLAPGGGVVLVELGPTVEGWQSAAAAWACAARGDDSKVAPVFLPWWLADCPPAHQLRRRREHAADTEELVLREELRRGWVLAGEEQTVDLTEAQILWRRRTMERLSPGVVRSSGWTFRESHPGHPHHVDPQAVHAGQWSIPPALDEARVAERYHQPEAEHEPEPSPRLRTRRMRA